MEVIGHDHDRIRVEWLSVTHPSKSFS